MDFACTSKTCPEQIKALSGVPTPARRAFFGVKHGVAALHGARGKKPRLVWTSVALSVPPITEEPGTLTQYRVPLSVFPGFLSFWESNPKLQSPEWLVQDRTTSPLGIWSPFRARTHVRVVSDGYAPPLHKVTPAHSGISVSLSCLATGRPQATTLEVNNHHRWIAKGLALGPVRSTQASISLLTRILPLAGCAPRYGRASLRQCVVYWYLLIQ